MHKQNEDIVIANKPIYPKWITISNPFDKGLGIDKPFDIPNNDLEICAIPLSYFFERDKYEPVDNLMTFDKISHRKRWLYNRFT